MRITVKLFGEFREAAGRDRVELVLPPGSSCGQALRELAKLEPQVGKLLFTGEGRLRDHLHVFVNGRNVATMQGLDTRLAAGDVVSFFPPIGGG
ncbi:TPA: MoaD/ThiS family protein [Candidatus Bipolaricaulota bacterium]|nr:MoaD/ThiS family protein [Candidatus Bipolaricaulota bacterium]HIP98990.1 MoaD/ThiS family protein [Candidatus Bipolaricaulota bacterium]